MAIPKDYEVMNDDVVKVSASMDAYQKEVDYYASNGYLVQLEFVEEAGLLGEPGVELTCFKQTEPTPIEASLALLVFKVDRIADALEKANKREHWRDRQEPAETPSIKVHTILPEDHGIGSFNIKHCNRIISTPFGRWEKPSTEMSDLAVTLFVSDRM